MPRRRALPRSRVTGPLRYVSNSRLLTREELRGAGLERPWSLAQLTCGHAVLRVMTGQRRVHCGFCREEELER